MTEQELEQHRADLQQLDIEQLRFGVMMQLHTIESLTAENEKLHALRHEREDVISNIKDAARLALDALEHVDQSKMSSGWVSMALAIAALKAAL